LGPSASGAFSLSQLTACEKAPFNPKLQNFFSLLFLLEKIWSKNKKKINYLKNLLEKFK